MSDAEPSGKSPSRRTILRDLIVFQVKLWLEGFKDFVLMPLSLGAALLDLVFRGGTLYAVMRLGDRFERWVNLYGALDEGSVAEVAPSHVDPMEDRYPGPVRGDETDRSTFRPEQEGDNRTHQ